MLRLYNSMLSEIDCVLENAVQVKQKHKLLSSTGAEMRAATSNLLRERIRWDEEEGTAE